MEQILIGIRDSMEAALTGGECIVHISRFPRDATGFINKVYKTLPDETTLRVYAIGGDGILFDCLNGIIGLGNTELAAVPYGNSSSFVAGFGRHNMGYFRNITRQADSAAIPVDVIRSGNSHALNFCAIGADAQIVKHSMNICKVLQKNGYAISWLNRGLYKFLYYMGTVFACGNTALKQQSYEIDIDGENLSGKYRNILIANGSCFGDSGHPASGVLSGGGKMDVVLARAGSLLKTVRHFPLHLSRRHTRFPKDFVVRKARKVRVRSDTFMHVNYDGVSFYEYDLTAEVIPGAVRFVDVTASGYPGIRENA